MCGTQVIFHAMNINMLNVLCIVTSNDKIRFFLYRTSHEEIVEISLLFSWILLYLSWPSIEHIGLDLYLIGYAMYQSVYPKDFLYHEKSLGQRQIISVSYPLDGLGHSFSHTLGIRYSYQQ